MPTAAGGSSPAAATQAGGTEEDIKASKREERKAADKEKRKKRRREKKEKAAEEDEAPADTDPQLGKDQPEPELEPLKPDPTPKPDGSIMAESEVSKREKSKVGSTPKPEGSRMAGSEASKREKSKADSTVSRMKTREWTSLPGEKTMLQTEWTMAPGEEHSPAPQTEDIDASNFDINAYDDDNKLSHKEYFKRFNAGNLRILQELDEWKKRYLGDTVNMTEEADKLLSKGIEWKPMAQSLQVNEKDQLEVEEELARLQPLTLPELMEIVCDPHPVS